jgi:hypothetical protein
MTTRILRETPVAALLDYADTAQAAKLIQEADRIVEQVIVNTNATDEIAVYPQVAKFLADPP